MIHHHNLQKVCMLIAALLLSGHIYAQSGNFCKGLKNPTTFSTSGGSNNANAVWYGYEGHKDDYTSTCGDWGMRQWGSQIPASQLASRSSGSSCTSSNSVDINNQQDYMRRFVIKGPGTDPLTSNHLSYLPPDST